MNTPFKVICITREDFTGDAFEEDELTVGTRYTVLREGVAFTKKGYAVQCYKLAEMPGPWMYDKRNFAILPEQSADEMQEEAREAIVNIEKAVV